ncbi:MAG: hypothetical protein BWY61_01948 [Firmicutes bacterium ADurb.Bin354]|nr:MAG: hypothetical protein BWY61_01948 [Firmicutes bacterium ADurb.Bin354]
MKLNSLELIEIRTLCPEITDLLNSRDISDLNFLVEIIILGKALNGNKDSFLQRLKQFVAKLHRKDDLKPHCIRIVCCGTFGDLVSVLGIKAFYCNDLTTYYGIGGLAYDGFHGHGFAFKIPSVDDIGIIAHLKGSASSA